MKYAWLSSLMSNVKVDVSLSGWPATTAVLGLGAIGLAALHMLIGADALPASSASDWGD